MEKFILVGFQNMPQNQPKFLKEFQNGNPDGKGIFGKAGNSPANGALAGMLGFTSSNLKIKYSEGLENVMIFETEAEAGLAQQALNGSFHGRHNSWCVRKFDENTTITGLVKYYLSANRHIERYAKALAEMEKEEQNEKK